MPKVPVYDEPQVRQAPLPTPYARAVPDAQDMGAGVGLAAMASVREAMRIREDEAQREDAKRLVQAEDELARSENELLFGANGAFQKRGDNAINLTPATLDAWEKARGAVGAKLSTPRQREAFGRMASSRRSQVERQLLVHEGREIEAARGEAYAARLKTASDTVALNGADQVRLGNELSRAETIIRAAAAERGLGADWVAWQTAAFRSDALRAAVGTLFSQGLDDQAKALFEKHRESFQAADRAQIEQSLKASGDRRAAQIWTAKIFDANAGDLAGALTAARAQITDPELQDDVVNRLKARFDERKAAENVADEADFEKAYAIFLRRGTTDAIPSDLWQRMVDRNPRGADFLRNEQLQAAARAGEPTASDLNAWGDWLLLSPDEKLLPANDPRILLKGKVSTAMVARALEEKRDIKESREGLRNGIEVKGPALSRDAINKLISQAALLKGVKGKTVADKNRLAALNVYVWDRLTPIEEAEKRLPRRDEVQAILDEALVRGERVDAGPLWSDVNAYAFEAQGDPSFRPLPGEGPQPAAPIPFPTFEEARPEIEAAFRRKGVPVTEDALRAAYEAKRLRVGVGP